MTHKDTFIDKMGTLGTGKKAFVIDIGSVSGNPFKIISKKYTGDARMAKVGQLVYLEAETCTHVDAVEILV